jgi:hypothetical protein
MVPVAASNAAESMTAEFTARSRDGVAGEKCPGSRTGAEAASALGTGPHTGGIVPQRKEVARDHESRACNDQPLVEEDGTNATGRRGGGKRAGRPVGDRRRGRVSGRSRRELLDCVAEPGSGNRRILDPNFFLPA